MTRTIRNKLLNKLLTLNTLTKAENGGFIIKPFTYNLI